MSKDVELTYYGPVTITAYTTTLNKVPVCHVVIDHDRHLMLSYEELSQVLDALCRTQERMREKLLAGVPMNEARPAYSGRH